jgi:2-polyprenyl-3-methyl-5-hydroxy-6-metoxy-1,4-benzoquinol methylase
VCPNPGTIDAARDKRLIPAVTRHLSGQSFTVWRCVNCGSLHSQEPVDLGDCYANYPVSDHQMNFHTRLAYRNRLRLLKRHGLGLNDSILDYGCGAGLFVRFLRETGYRDVRGFDPYVDGFSDQSSLRDPCDVVVSYDVVEHHDDPKSFLEGVVRLVKPGGLLVIGTPNASSIELDRLDEFFMDLQQPYHRHILSEHVLLELLAQSGVALQTVDRRSHWDTWVPTVNSRFLWTYCYKGGGVETVIGPPDVKLIVTSPSLLFYALFGYFYPTTGSLTLILRRRQSPGACEPRDGGRQDPFDS